MTTGSGSNLIRVYSSAEAALAGLDQGASLFVSGYAGRHEPAGLLDSVIHAGVGGLTVICQGGGAAGTPPSGIDRLVEAGLVKKLISPLPFNPRDHGAIKRAWESRRLELEVQPTGVLAERIRAGGAGLGGIFLPTGAGTRFAEGREVRVIDGREHLFQPAIRADFALIRAAVADSLGNLTYSGTGRNWSPIMAMSARVTVAEVDEIREPGGLDPEFVITPAIFVQRMIQSRSLG